MFAKAVPFALPVTLVAALIAAPALAQDAYRAPGYVAPPATPAPPAPPVPPRSHSVLIVDGTFDKNFEMSARNLSHVALLPASGLNVYDIMRSEKLVLTKAALTAIEERFA